MTSISYAVVNEDSGMVENIIVWDGESEWSPPEGCFAVINDVGAGIGWSYANGAFTPPPPIPPTDAEIEASNRVILAVSNQLATSQKAALANRISIIQDAIDLDIATPEEISEMPIRKAQQVEWKTYAVYLGRVTQQEGWALTVVWPEQPEIAIT